MKPIQDLVKYQRINKSASIALGALIQSEHYTLIDKCNLSFIMQNPKGKYLVFRYEYDWGVTNIQRERIEVDSLVKARALINEHESLYYI